MHARSVVRSLVRPAAIAALCLLAPVAVHAQGRGNGHGNKPHKQDKHHKQSRRVVTVDHAIVTTREILVAQGYTVVRVERSGPAQVVYFRRGSRGRGHGHGPVERIIVRPAGDVVVIDQGPSAVVADIRVRLRL